MVYSYQLEEIDRMNIFKIKQLHIVTKAHFKYNDVHSLKVKYEKVIYYENNNQKKTSIIILISKKWILGHKEITKNREVH